MKYIEPSAEILPFPENSFVGATERETAFHEPLVHTPQTTATSQARNSHKTLQKKEKRKRATDRNADRFLRAGDGKRARRMYDCGREIVRREFECGHRDGWYSASKRCMDRFCPICQTVRAKRYGEKFGRALDRIVPEEKLHPSFLTLTWKNMRALPDLKELRECVKKLFRSPLFKGLGYWGALVAFEITGSVRKGWHPHFHCVILTKAPIPLVKTGKCAGHFQKKINQAIADEWEKITGDSFIVLGKKLEDGGMREVIKYACGAPEELPENMFLSLAEWVRGKRLISTLGGLYKHPYLKGIEDEEDEAGAPECCSECGCADYTDVRLKWDGHGHYRTTGVETVRRE